MKTAPIVPAVVDVDGGISPRAPAFGDASHARAGALSQAEDVFIAGNGLPGRWSGRTRFVILETGFGLGQNFLATWAAWRADAARCERLVFISVEPHPLTRADLARAHSQAPDPIAPLAEQLLEAWPPLTPNLHTLDFEDGHVRLMLALGDAHDWLPEIVARVDAFYLDGLPPGNNTALWTPDLLKRIARLASEDATIATWCVARGFREDLAAAGFALDRKPGVADRTPITVGSFAPRHRPPMPPAREAIAPHAREVLIVGGGLAGAACARALSRQGVRCTILESGDGLASKASGNPGGLFHGTLNADDGLHARFNRAAALMTERALRRLAPRLPWLQWGLLRVERDPDAFAGMQALQQRSGLPSDYVRALSAEEASAAAGLSLSQPAWFFPGGGAVSPPSLVEAWMREAQADVRLNVTVGALCRAGSRWQALDAQGQVMAEGDAVILCGGTGSEALAAAWSAGPEWPWSAQRGQLSLMADDQSPPQPEVPVAGLGYALSLPGGALAFGATADIGDDDPSLRDADHRQNLSRLRQLIPGATHLSDTPARGRVGWRSLMPDKLPVIGALPASTPSQRAEQVRFWPRHPGLMICGAMGSRGLTWSALCGELIAAQLLG
ncbi:MAG: FAD-dependent 5-carboxymethylaminomethyl-2-thiouridine(34) oxidoreductase MnmC, partial [Burkholderiaceae bacterium]